MRAAEHALSAARDERLPSLALNADYGAIGSDPGQAHGTYNATATLSVPIWLGAGARKPILSKLMRPWRSARPNLTTPREKSECQIREAFLDFAGGQQSGRSFAKKY